MRPRGAVRLDLHPLACDLACQRFSVFNRSLAGPRQPNIQ
jgi:hypothetical protein